MCLRVCLLMEVSSRFILIFNESSLSGNPIKPSFEHIDMNIPSKSCKATVPVGLGSQTFWARGTLYSHLM